MEKEKKEIRSLGNFEIRQVGEGDEKQTHLQGYALTFNTISEDLGFKETISKNALDNTDMSDVILSFNHNASQILARNNKSDGIGSLVLTVDDTGLFFDAIPTNTSYAKDLIANMESGIVGKCSFAFSLDWSDPDAQKWEWDDGKGYDFRTINKIASLSDVSIVVHPAYESTSSTLYKRCKGEHDDKITKEKELRELAVDLELLRLQL